LLITTLLLVLTLRAAKLPGTPLANIVFAVCGMFWSAGGLVHAALLASGAARDSLSALAAQALQYTGAAAFPVPILAIWRPFAVRRRQKAAARVLEIASWATAAAIAGFLWFAPPPFATISRLTAYNAGLFILRGGDLLRRDPIPRPFGPSLIVTAVPAPLSALRWPTTRTPRWLATAFSGSHPVLLVLVLLLSLFARFRYADVFTAGFAFSAGFLGHDRVFECSVRHIFYVASQATSPARYPFLSSSCWPMSSCSLSPFYPADQGGQPLLFREPDYRAALRQPRRLRRSAWNPRSERLEEAARAPLELNGRTGWRSPAGCRSLAACPFWKERSRNCAWHRCAGCCPCRTSKLVPIAPAGRSPTCGRAPAPGDPDW
jgi:two-component system LytT family sensor kinase